jgi:hypothetical protein
MSDKKKILEFYEYESAINSKIEIIHLEKDEDNFIPKQK